MRVSLATLSVFIGFLQLTMALVTLTPTASSSDTTSMPHAIALPSVSTTLTGILTAPAMPTAAPNQTPHSFSIIGMSTLYASGSGSPHEPEPTGFTTVPANAGQKVEALSHRWLYAGCALTVLGITNVVFL